MSDCCGPSNPAGWCGPPQPVVTIVAGPQGVPGVAGPPGASSAAGAMIHLLANGSVPNVIDYALPWGAVYYDDLASWNPVTPSRLLVPVGTTRVRVSAGIRWQSNSIGWRKARIRGNPGGFYEGNGIWASDERLPANNGDCTITTGIILVEDLTYFELLLNQSSGAALAVLGTGSTGRGTWMQIETFS